MTNKDTWITLNKELASKDVKLIAVSKTKPTADILDLYSMGQRDFGENYVQELVDKQDALPADINWHFIGHLQSNKVKYIAPFVHLIHTVDSFSLLTEINKQATKSGRIINVLLQMYIAVEESKFGLDETEILSLLDYYEAQNEQLKNVRICGLMGMATNTNNEEQVNAEFQKLHNFFLLLKDTNFFAKDYFSICSMGMSSDYKTAIAAGSNTVRIGSMLFGSR
jgi:pyridoxal phosphate enzyme (YggS family)